MDNIEGKNKNKTEQVNMGSPSDKIKVRRQSIIDPNKSLLQVIWQLAWPVIIEMMLLTVVGIVDMAMVGRLGASSIAAVGLGGQIIMLATTAFAAIRTGTTALVARHIGADDKEGAMVIARQSVSLTMILSAVTFVIFSIFARESLVLLGAADDVIALGVGYIRWRTIGLAFSLITMIFTSMLRGSGDTKTSMYVNIVVNIVNPVLNYMLIFGNLGAPKMGVSGAALATTIAQIVGCFLIVRVILKGKKAIKLSLKDDFRLKLVPIKRILNIGIPAMMESVAMRFAQIVFTIILTSLGTATYAAHQIAIRAESLSYMPGWGFGVAATTLVGQYLGAERPDLAERAGYIARNMAVALAIVMGFAFYFFPYQIVSIFTDDASVVDKAAQALRIVALVQPSMAINIVLSGGLRGAGDTRWVTYITAGSVWIVRLSIAAFCVYVLHWGLIGAWMGMVGDQFIRSILISIRFARGKWKTLKV